MNSQNKCQISDGCGNIESKTVASVCICILVLMAPVLANSQMRLAFKTMLVFTVYVCIVTITLRVRESINGTAWPSQILLFISHL